jgi:AbrB family looped-hinge helix DNA binding protein
MSTVCVTSNGQITIPKRVRQALGINPGSKVEIGLEGSGARIKVVKRVTSRIEDGPGILNYCGPRIPVAKMHGGVAMKKADARARD